MELVKIVESDPRDLLQMMKHSSLFGDLSCSAAGNREIQACLWDLNLTL